MSLTNISRTKRTLLTCFSVEDLNQQARETGFLKRERDIKPLSLAISMMAALGGDGQNKTLADLHRKFNEMANTSVSRHSWREQVTKQAFPKLLLWLWIRCLTSFCRKVLAFSNDSPFAQFQHIWLHDGSSQAINRVLKDAFPGRFSKVSPAAVELHTTMDLLIDNIVRVELTEDTRSERACLPKLQSSLLGTLILLDAGYFDVEYFGAVDDREGHFLCKAPQSINPVIHTAIREDGKNYNRCKGKKLKEVLAVFPKDQCMDLDVEWPYKLRRRTFRLIVRWNGEKQCWVFIVTNLPREQFSLKDVLLAYRLRWQIELIFKEIKSYAGWHRFNTKSLTLVVSLVLLSFIVATLKRYLAHAAEAGMSVEISTQKVAKSGTHLYGNLMQSLLNGSRKLYSDLEQLISYWQENSRREHPVRDSRTGRSALGLKTIKRP